MLVLLLLAFAVLAVVAVAILSLYARLNQLPMYLALPLVISVYIPLSIVVLVPIDLANHGGLDNKGRLIMWRVIYWSSFVLTWAVLPILQYYMESGYFVPLQRLKDALRSTLRYQLTLLAAGVVGLIYMGVSSGLNPKNLAALAVALSYCYSLVLTIWLLGHGLVNLPRNAWNATIEQRLAYYYAHANGVCDAYAEAHTAYEDVVAKIMALGPVKPAAYSEWIDDLTDDIRKHNLPLSRTTAPSPPESDVTEEYIANLARRFYRDQHRAVRARADWASLVQNCAYYEDLNKAKDSGTLEFRFYVPAVTLSPSVAYLLFVKVRPYLVRGLAVTLAIGSAALAWSEIVAGTSWSLVDIVVRGAVGFWQLVLAAAILGYMCVATFSALATVRVFNLYALVPRDSDPSSLIFYAMYACRLAVPLSYNFLVLNTAQATVFQEFLGQYINLTPLGKYFNSLLPRFIVVPMLLTYFGFYDRLKSYLGFGIDVFDDNDHRLSTEAEGRDLVRRALTDPRFRWSLT